jgi:outer membrane biosynthesis protein TonB
MATFGALSASVAFPSSAADAPYHVDDPKNWGTLARVITPAYPMELFSLRIGGVVEVEGAVDGYGALTEIQYKANSPDAAGFIASLKDVAPYWLMIPPIGDDCFPSTQRVTTRVIFEAGDVPKVAFEYVKKLPRSEPRQLRPLTRQNPSYPRGMIEQKIEARVFASLDVDPAGKVDSARAAVYPASKGQPLPRHDPDYDAAADAFSKSAVSALSGWRFPAAEGIPADRRVCYEIVFLLPS